IEIRGTSRGMTCKDKDPALRENAYDSSKEWRKILDILKHPEAGHDIKAGSGKWQSARIGTGKMAVSQACPICCPYHFSGQVHTTAKGGASVDKACNPADATPKIQDAFAPKVGSGKLLKFDKIEEQAVRTVNVPVRHVVIKCGYRFSVGIQLGHEGKPTCAIF